MKSDQNQVTLKDMMLKSAGQFRCEISAEAPLFNTVSQSRPLTIIGKYMLIIISGNIVIFSPGGRKRI